MKPPSLRRLQRAFLTVLLLSAPLAPVRPADNDIVLLEVVWNNPFNPSRGEVTRFQYGVRQVDSSVRLWVFTADGRPVAELADHLAQAGAVYSVDWDGRNNERRLVDSGIYFAVLDAGRYRRKMRRVAVLKE